MIKITRFSVFITLLAVTMFGADGPVYAGEKHLFYFNGINLENVGEYDYNRIIDSLKADGFNVIYEPRYNDSDSIVQKIANETAVRVKSLLEAGTPPEDITVSGYSFGSIITLFSALAIDNPKINYVLIAGCPGRGARYFEIDYARIQGRVLSIFDKEDDIFGSCSTKLSGAVVKEVSVDVGGHAGFRSPDPDLINTWKEPLKAWTSTTTQPAVSKNVSADTVNKSADTKSKKLTGDQVKTLFSDKEFIARNIEKQKDFGLITTSDGENTVVLGSGKKLVFRWWVNNAGQRCADHPSSGERCYDVIDMGDGTYHQMLDGEHTHTLTVK